MGDRKEEGYLIVGLEQTSSSQSLLEYKFSNQPTVLLLGKEKEGIPVELLHVVDECIEIPQLGIIRRYAIANELPNSFCMSRKLTSQFTALFLLAKSN